MKVTVSARMRTMSHSGRDEQSEIVLVIVDATRGDVVSTNEAYSEANQEQPLFSADELTVHPYLWLTAMGDSVRVAEDSPCHFFVVLK